MRGLFITVEGVDGAGKTTQCRLLEDKLTHRGYEVCFTQEPGGTEVGKQLKSVLLNPDNNEITDISEVFLYEADRHIHTKHFIEPALKEGKIVLCDRYADSTIAYQGYGKGMNVEWIIAQNNIATDGLTPDLTILLDIDPIISIQRKLLPKDRMEANTIEFHKRVREGFIALAESYPDRLKVIEGNRRVGEVEKDIWLTIQKLFEEKSFSSFIKWVLKKSKIT